MSTKKLQILNPFVTSVNGQTSDVVLTKGNVGLGNVDNTSDKNKPISTATQKALDAKQVKITASGPLVGDGNGEVSAGPWPCNHNMLDNWYLANPVNQRGKVVYSTSGFYSIDRWILGFQKSNGTVTVNDGCVTVTITNSNGGFVDIIQRFEKPLAQGTIITLTALMSDGSIITRTGGLGNMAALATNQWRSGQPDHVAFRVTSGSVNIVAVKMELGDKQTLCRLGNNGKYILNEVPNFQQQLAQCQRFCVAIEHQTYKRADLGSLSQFWFYIPTPVTLRSNPSIEGSSTPVVYSFDTDTAIAQSGFTFKYDIAGFCNASIRIRATKNKHGLHDAAIYLGDMVFSADI